jgi:hypothetical protein
MPCFSRISEHRQTVAHALIAQRGLIQLSMCLKVALGWRVLPANAVYSAMRLLSICWWASLWPVFREACHAFNVPF